MAKREKGGDRVKNDDGARRTGSEEKTKWKYKKVKKLNLCTSNHALCCVGDII